MNFSKISSGEPEKIRTSQIFISWPYTSFFLKCCTLEDYILPRNRWGKFGKPDKPTFHFFQLSNKSVIPILSQLSNSNFKELPPYLPILKVLVIHNRFFLYYFCKKCFLKFKKCLKGFKKKIKINKIHQIYWTEHHFSDNANSKNLRYQFCIKSDCLIKFLL